MKHILQSIPATLLFAIVLTASSPLYSIAADTNVPERAIVTKAKSIVLPEFKLDGVTFSEAIRQLYIVNKQHDPDGKGVNIMATGPAIAVAKPKITLALKNVTVEEAAERLAKTAGVRMIAEDYAFVFFRFHPESDKP